MLFTYIFLGTTIALIFAVVGLTIKIKQDKRDSFEESEKLFHQIRGAITSQLLADTNADVFTGIAKQRRVLADNNRESVAIFLRPDLFKRLLSNAFKSNVETVYNIMIGLNVPVGYLGEVPVYVSKRLKDAPVFVAGGITWEL